MKAFVDEDLCAGCASCEPACPTDAISMSDEDVAVVDHEKCEACGDCVDACPTEAIELKEV